MLLGFSGAMYGTFGGLRDDSLSLEGFDTMYDASLTLFAAFLGDVDLSLFEAYEPFYRVLGSATMIGFVFLATIVGANLLIAVMSNEYKPDEMEDKHDFERCELIQSYMIHADNRMLPSPFNLVQLPLDMLLKAPAGDIFVVLDMLLITPLDLCEVPGARSATALIFLVFVYPILLPVVAIYEWRVFIVYPGTASVQWIKEFESMWLRGVLLPVLPLLSTVLWVPFLVIVTCLLWVVRVVACFINMFRGGFFPFLGDAAVVDGYYDDADTGDDAKTLTAKIKEELAELGGETFEHCLTGEIKPVNEMTEVSTTYIYICGFDYMRTYSFGVFYLEINLHKLYFIFECHVDTTPVYIIHSKCALHLIRFTFTRSY